MYPYLSITEKDEREMLDVIGLNTLDDLFADIPKDISLNRKLKIPASKSELEVRNYLIDLASKNITSTQMTSFLGAGAYDHYIPTIIQALISRQEYYTAYTPYQPEISQGTLQYIFEYQTLMARLTGMEYSNASMYDGGTALMEAALMTVNHAKKKDIIVSRGVSYQARQILRTYANAQNLNVIEVNLHDGVTDLEELEEILDKEVGTVIVQSPNFLGNVEDLAATSEIVHKFKKCYLVASVDPISLAIFKKPGELGVDVCVGDGQALGINVNFGGPFLGFMTFNTEFLRKFPGRIIGQTVDMDGKRAWVLTLAAREQHIRREKATSNICSNQGINTLRAAIYMTTMGKAGLKEVAVQSTMKAHYAFNKLTKGNKPKCAPVSKHAPFFKEFAVRLKKPAKEVNKILLKNDIIGGFDLSQFYPELGNAMLIAVTEKRTKEEIDKLVSILEEV